MGPACSRGHEDHRDPFVPDRSPAARRELQVVRRQRRVRLRLDPVAVDTDDGLTGWGEICPLGPTYLPAYAAGVRAGLGELAQHLLGADPLALGLLNEWMDAAMRGHGAPWRERPAGRVT